MYEIARMAALRFTRYRADAFGGYHLQGQANVTEVGLAEDHFLEHAYYALAGMSPVDFKAGYGWQALR